MRDLSKDFNHRQDHKASLVLLIMLMSLFAINLALEFWFGSISFLKSFFISGAFFMFFRFYYQSLKDLLYTFWGLTLFLGLTLLYFFFDALASEHFNHHATLIFSMLVIHGLIIYVASSPVYYPRVYWWEFEFRYRADFKVFFEYEDTIDEGRLTDIRREGAAFYSFQSFAPESLVKLNFEYLDEDYNFDVILGSKGRNIPGRPYSYGIKFILSDNEQKNSYKKLAQSWRHRNKIKIQERFET